MKGGPWKREGQNEKAINGESGIRTHVALAHEPVFETGAFSRSAISPEVYAAQTFCAFALIWSRLTGNGAILFWPDKMVGLPFGNISAAVMTRVRSVPPRMGDKFCKFSG
jgi:hypothetical protein